MEPRALVLLTAAAALLVTTLPAVAHHSVSAMWDPKQPKTLTGVISEIQWFNPHIYVYVDVKDEAGRMTTWRLETWPPAQMRKAGITKKLLFGNRQAVRVDVWGAKNKSPDFGWILKIDYSDGREYKFWDPSDTTN